MPLSVLTFLLLAISYLYRRVTLQRLTTARIPGLVSLSLERLADQAARVGEGGEKGVLAAQLRDDILRDEWDVSRREKVWARVRDVVERNANVRASRREVGGGEVGRVWEWIGAVDAMVPFGEDGRRGSGRMGLGRVASEEQLGSGSGSGAGEPLRGKEMVQKGGWMESRPIY